MIEHTETKKKALPPYPVLFHQLPKAIDRQLLAFLNPREFIHFKGLTQAWRQYISSNLSNLFQLYPVDRPLKIKFKNFYQQRRNKNTLYINKYTHSDRFNYYFNPTDDYRVQEKYLTEEEATIRLGEDFNREQLATYLLNQESIETSDKLIREQVLKDIPDTSLTNLHHILSVLKKHQNQRAYQNHKYDNSFEYLKSLIQDKEALAHECHKDIALAYFVIKDPWFRSHLPEKEQLDVNPYASLYLLHPINILKYALLQGVSLLICLDEEVFLVLISFYLISMLIIVYFTMASLLVTALVSLPLTFAILFAVVLLSSIITLPFEFLFSTAPSSTVQRKADAYAYMLGKIPGAEYVETLELKQEIETISQELAQLKAAVEQDVTSFQLKVIEKAIRQLDKVSTPLELLLYKEKEKILCMFLQKNETLECGGRFSFFFSSQRTQKKKQAIENLLDQIDEIHTLPELVLFKENLLSNQALTAQRNVFGNFGTVCSDTYKQILSLS